MAMSARWRDDAAATAMVLYLYRHRLDPTRFILMDQINSTGDVVDYGDFM